MCTSTVWPLGIQSAVIVLIFAGCTCAVVGTGMDAVAPPAVAGRG
jgi:hypothetical protein